MKDALLILVIPILSKLYDKFKRETSVKTLNRNEVAAFPYTLREE